MIDETLAVVKKAEALVNILNDVQAEVQGKRIGDLQLVKTLANRLEGMDTKTLVAH